MGLTHFHRPAADWSACRRAVLPIVALAASLGACRDETVSPNGLEPTPSLAAASASLIFRQVSAGRFHTCGATTDYRAYCWGYGFFGELGTGTTANQLRPILVATTRHFRQLSTGAEHSCGLTTDSLAFCWGSNFVGQLGNGTMISSLTPVAVAGGRRFRQIRVGYQHTCAVTSSNRVYCWGWNGYGQLGDGSTSNRLKPVAVAGGYSFRLVSSGKEHTCALTLSNVAFCWGSNQTGQIGDSTQASQRLLPTKVAGGRHFSQLEAGHYHTCAVASATARGYCWGNGSVGQIGDGKPTTRWYPKAVAGGLLFSSVSAGEVHTCGVTTNNRAYCWGNNDFYGELGDGTTTSHFTPVAVAGGLSFNQVSAGDSHTCAVTPAGKAYCWGRNDAGMLGDGTTENRLTPVPVSGPM